MKKRESNLFKVHNTPKTVGACALRTEKLQKLGDQ